jgi:hypothetical protein
MTENMVPKRDDIVEVVESTGLKYHHRATSSKVLKIIEECSLRYPKNGHLRNFTDWKQERRPLPPGIPSHRYPITDNARSQAFEVGEHFKHIMLLSYDPKGLIRDSLLVACSICLSWGGLIEEQFLEIFDRESSDSTLLSKKLHAYSLGKPKTAYYSKEIFEKVSFSLNFFLNLSLSFNDTHPVPETIEQKEIAVILRKHYENIMWQRIPHDIRNYTLTAAARSLQLGLIFTKSFERINEAYGSSLGRDRGARMYSENKSLYNSPPDDDDEDQENLSPYGTI